MRTTGLSSYGSEKGEHPLSQVSRPPSTPTNDDNSDEQFDETPDEEFTLGRRGILVVLTLCVLTLMAALDGTSLSVALPVSQAANPF